MTKLADKIEALSTSQRDLLLSDGCSISAEEAGRMVQLGLMAISFEWGGCGARLTDEGREVREALRAREANR